MFELADPWWLLAFPLAVLPLVAWLRPHVLRFPGAAGERSAWPGMVTVLPALAEALAIGFTVIALARPQHVETETVRDSEGLDILLAIDTSGSMRSPDMGRGLQPLSRLDAAKAVMQRFVEARHDDRLGLLVFGEEAFVEVPPTLDSGALVDFIGSLELGMAGGNATAVGDAIAVGVKRLKDLKAPSKLIILVTDGKSNSGMVQPMDAAAAILSDSTSTMAMTPMAPTWLSRMISRTRSRGRELRNPSAVSDRPSRCKPPWRAASTITTPAAPITSLPR